MATRLNAKLLAPELTITTSRSSGPGGQNVNKVSTRVTLRFSVESSRILTDEEKQIIRQKLGAHITKEGDLLIDAQESRSQLQNREAVVAKLDTMLLKAFTRRKKRKPTKPTRASKDERIRRKKQLSEKKQWRQKPL